MKYKIYKKTETIEKYKIKRNTFNKKYTIKLYYVDSNQYEVYEAENKKYAFEFERFLLDKMNNQIEDLFNNIEMSDNIIAKIDENVDRFSYIANKIAFIIPTIFTLIYKNGFNMFLYLPLKLLNIVMAEKIKDDYVSISLNDIEKYELFKDNIELLENYSKYVIKNNITANNIDKYSLEKLKQILRIINTLIEDKEIKVLKKEMS